MNELTAFEVYWILQMDNFVRLFTGMLAASIVCAVTAFVFAAMIRDGCFEGDAKTVFRYARRIAGLSVVLGVIVSLTPSTKTLCAIYVVPAIVNNETLQDDASDIYALGVQRLKEALGDTGAGK